MCPILTHLLYHHGAALGAVVAVLHHVGRGEFHPGHFPLSARDLARALGCTPHVAQRHLRGLCSAGHIARLGTARTEMSRYRLGDELTKVVEALRKCDRCDETGEALTDWSSRVYMDMTRKEPVEPSRSSSIHTPRARSGNAVTKRSIPVPADSPWRLLPLCLPQVRWSDHLRTLRAGGVGRAPLETVARAAVAEILTGKDAVRSWQRWLRAVARAPEDVPEATWQRIATWAAELEGLRTRLRACGHPVRVDDAPDSRNAVQALLKAAGAESPESWSELVSTYGGSAVVTVLEEGDSALRPIALEYHLWGRFGADTLVAMKERELADLASSCVAVIGREYAVEAAHG